jgi:hypothetical protein
LFVFGGWWLGGYWERAGKGKRRGRRPFREGDWGGGAGIEDQGAEVGGRRGSEGDQRGRVRGQRGGRKGRDTRIEDRGAKRAKRAKNITSLKRGVERV